MYRHNATTGDKSIVSLFDMYPSVDLLFNHVVKLITQMNSIDIS